MRYRALTSTGDYRFGHGKQDFLVDSPATVAQAIQTGLLLFQGEWFLDIEAGMPWGTQVLGYGTQPLYDTVIKSKILSITGVKSIITYSSSLSRAKRALTVSVTVDTAFGITSVTTTIGGGGFGVGGFGERGFGE
jgi:hypothetical protein